MIEIKYHECDKPKIDYAFKIFDADILNGKFGKRIRFYFTRHNGERDWWTLHPYRKYVDAGEEQPDCIKINGKRYIGDDLYKLAREILLKKEAEVLDILEG